MSAGRKKKDASAVENVPALKKIIAVVSAGRKAVKRKSASAEESAPAPKKTTVDVNAGRKINNQSNKAGPMICLAYCVMEKFNG